MIKITERAATLEDFLNGKSLTDKNGKKAKGNPFIGWRTVSKTVNFLVDFWRQCSFIYGYIEKVRIY